MQRIEPLSSQRISGEVDILAIVNLTADWPDTPLRESAKNSGTEAIDGTVWSLKPLASI